MVLFEWDEAKGKINRLKQGISFEDAMLVLPTLTLWSSRTG